MIFVIIFVFSAKISQKCKKRSFFSTQGSINLFLLLFSSLPPRPCSLPLYFALDGGGGEGGEGGNQSWLVCDALPGWGGGGVRKILPFRHPVRWEGRDARKLQSGALSAFGSSCSSNSSWDTMWHQLLYENPKTTTTEPDVVQETALDMISQCRCAADFSLLNLPKGKSLGRSKPATNS